MKKKSKNHLNLVKPHAAEVEYDIIQLPFAQLVFTRDDDEISAVHQFHTMPIHVYVPGGQMGLVPEQIYRVALDDFQPNKLTLELQTRLQELKDNPREAEKAWFELFQAHITEGIYSFVASKHGGLARAYGDVGQSEIGIGYIGHMLEITPLDITVAFTSRRRNNQQRIGISMVLGHGLGFLSQPEEPEFSDQGDFGWESAQGEYVYKTRKYHFQLSFDANLVPPDVPFNKPSFQVSLRKMLNAAIKDVTGQVNAIEKLTLY